MTIFITFNPLRRQEINTHNKMIHTEILNTKEAVIEYLENLTASELVQANDIYCELSNDFDGIIFQNNEDFFNVRFDTKIDAIRSVCYGTYNLSDDYVKLNGYGNVESFNNPVEYVDLSSIADYILDCPRCFDVVLVDENEE